MEKLHNKYVTIYFDDHTEEKAVKEVEKYYQNGYFNVVCEIAQRKFLIKEWSELNKCWSVQICKSWKTKK